MRLMKLLLPLLAIMVIASSMINAQQLKVYYDPVKAVGDAPNAQVVEREGQEIVTVLGTLTASDLKCKPFSLPISAQSYGDSLVFNYNIYAISATDTAEYRVIFYGTFDGNSLNELTYLVGTDSTYLENEGIQSGYVTIGPPFYPYYLIEIEISEAAPIDAISRSSFYVVTKR
ncbi:MAG: hypothetical protein A2V66_07175 [Ignavibacteria bacterium RBG_13_36_8]|nr:MAG: hypothetical protein A2V66_07175 [Ignavibacteria bacterium RBG_13_36_8]